MENKHVGFLVIVIAALIGFIIYSFNAALTDIVNAICSHGASCPMWGTIQFQTNVSMALMGFVALIGVYLIFFSRESIAPKKKSFPEPEGLTGDEKNVFEKIKEAEGSIFQSELVEKAELSKVRITRILDKLEGKGLIERKRRGMSNIVLLKH